MSRIAQFLRLQKSIGDLDRLRQLHDGYFAPLVFENDVAGVNKARNISKKGENYVDQQVNAAALFDKHADRLENRISI